MNNYTTYFTICGLFQISEMLVRTKHLHNANKILEIVSDWTEEEGFTESERYAELGASIIKLLQCHISELL